MKNCGLENKLLHFGVVLWKCISSKCRVNHDKGECWGINLVTLMRDESQQREDYKPQGRWWCVCCVVVVWCVCCWICLWHLIWLKCALVLGMGREGDPWVRAITFGIKHWPQNLSMKLWIREGIATALAWRRLHGYEQVMWSTKQAIQAASWQSCKSGELHLLSSLLAINPFGLTLLALHSVSSLTLLPRV